MEEQTTKRNSDKARAEQFEREAQQADFSLIREMFDLLRHNKKWWLTPIIIGLLLAGIIVVLGGTAVAPLIYTLF